MGHQIRWGSAGNITVDPRDSEHVAIVFSDRGAANGNATAGCFLTATGGLNIGTAPNYDPCGAGPGLNLNVYMVESTDGGETWSGRVALEGGSNSSWFPWADFKPDGTLAVAWDEHTAPAPADTFIHRLKVGGGAATSLGVAEDIDVSVTHWAGQYTTAWPAVCGPAGYPEGEGKDCNVFHGDYTGLAVGSDGSINVVWTGLNRLGGLHDGYAQDACTRSGRRCKTAETVGRSLGSVSRPG